MFFCKLFRMADDEFSSNSQSTAQNENGNANAEPNVPFRLDLGDDPIRNGDHIRLENQNSVPSVSSTSSNSVPSEGHRREDNPFSFKHFLRSDSNSGYQNKGARPKVYGERRSASSDFVTNRPPEPKQSVRMVPEFSSALPDFVQDHLVIEQCYLGNNPTNNYDLDVDNLPDFTPDRSSSRKCNSVDADNLPDFTPSRETRNSNGSRNANGSNSNDQVPLDLPIRPPDSFPLDLPLTGSSSSRNSTSEVGNSKSLPDFLTDSAVCTQKGEAMTAPHSPEGEVERLRHELEIVRRHLTEKNRLCESLSRELEIARNKEHEYTQNLSKALEQVENSLEKSNRRAASAEGTVTKLKQEIKTLTVYNGMCVSLSA
ncbi:unnamed protein product [Acanthoscelides obtectus]|uniref:Endosome-associated-trafficking regulator 1 n=1 Tax=Acanthoscelides obtectus TaxID=200917 RepID=A0A9P0L6B2_ACAOB|nr:unnamed protein product [Acanthoscelides obtectus]CAK1631015.1 hypothetical protein AOBTE_LOCUS6705 [Acanthoscelides obtectus]